MDALFQERSLRI